MTKRALLFPGQGAQKLGMAKDIYDELESGRAFLDQLNAALNFDVLELMFNDEAQLGLTQYTQPAIVSHSTAVLNELTIDYDYTVGHSLGEYAALVASGVLTAEDAVKIVAKRGELMATAFPKGTGSMAAVLGLTVEEVTAICEQLSTPELKVEPANLNCPGQIVVSGHQEKIDAFVRDGKSLGAKRVLPLNVSGPFHSSMMECIAEEFGAFLETFTFNDAVVPVVQNTTARPVTDKDEIKQQLIKQLYSPVRFEESIRYLIEQGVTEFVEVGPNKVLSGLIKKIDRNVTLTALGTVEEIKGWNAQ
ncbi:ACP S-malonyltransferase [Macrococcus equipercicus]|uniref:Malonyl CoA-acyl carrier protein transacylase n=1 Tax=Macrococcus equipercicus TaxID=69967 RepID=A0ABQ6RC71_9STAP|nr:ACP S-malonyltransferase [Macrococcus equipercicus]KAA1042769.1 ACP S-malonyltransferase [Macrococcus equipercicus]